MTTTAGGAGIGATEATVTTGAVEGGSALLVTVSGRAFRPAAPVVRRKA